jgi:hypothetical protein
MMCYSSFGNADPAALGWIPERPILARQVGPARPVT